MILGLGVDIVETARIERLLARAPERAARRLFSSAERERCRGRAREAECYAARFAAKEAFLKALGTGLRDGIRWRDVEVRLDGRGSPELRLGGAARTRLRERGGDRVHVSMSHEAGHAVAVVVIEGARGADG